CRPRQRSTVRLSEPRDSEDQRCGPPRSIFTPAVEAWRGASSCATRYEHRLSPVRSRADTDRAMKHTNTTPVWSAPEILVEGDGPVRTVVINRPQHSNAVNEQMHDALADVWLH